MFQRRKPTPLKCPSCGQNREIGWLVCPWCTVAFNSISGAADGAIVPSLEAFPSSVSGRRNLVVAQLRRELDLSMVGKFSKEQTSSQIGARIAEIVNEFPLSPEEKEALITDVRDEMYGFGPLGELLRDELVTEIWIRNERSIMTRRNQKLEKSNAVFDDSQHLHRTVDKIIWQDDPGGVQLIVRRAKFGAE